MENDKKPCERCADTTLICVVCGQGYHMRCEHAKSGREGTAMDCPCFGEGETWTR